MTHVSSIAKGLLFGYELEERTLFLEFDDVSLTVRSNSLVLLDRLGEYFAPYVSNHVDPSHLEVIALERSAPDLGLDYIDWVREPGKKGRKDAYCDLEDGRVVKKVRTGMVFLQNREYAIAAGPCLANDNQVVNFINNQYMTRLQQDGALICHASALACGAKSMGIAGFSGGGKSTLMLHAMEHDAFSFVTNDRLFIEGVGESVVALGIPKQPRINPGTIVNNPRLHGLITPERRQELLDLPVSQLWDLEEKYDVMIEDVYGKGRIRQSAELSGFLILNWSMKSLDSCDIQEVDLEERRDLLAAVMKSPGPFYFKEDGSFWQADDQLVEQTYIDALADVPVFEATGGVDFEMAVDFVQQYLMR